MGADGVAQMKRVEVLRPVRCTPTRVSVATHVCMKFASFRHGLGVACAEG